MAAEGVEMRLPDHIMEKHEGKFAINNAGTLVIPQRGSERHPFDTEAEAEEWARENYRGSDWSVVVIGGKRQCR